MYEDVGNLKDLEASIKYLQAAVDITSEGHPGYPSMWKNLAFSYHSKFEKMGDLKDLNVAIENCFKAASGISEDNPEFPAIYHFLGVCYRDLFKSTENPGDLEASVKYSLVAINTTPWYHPSLSSRYQSLGLTYHHLFGLTGKLEDLDATVKYCLAAVNVAPAGSPHLIFMYQTLGSSYNDRYRRLGEVSDLEAAINRLQTAEAITPKGHPDLPKIHQILGVSYNDMFDRKADLEDLDGAIRYHTLAVETIQKEHPDVAFMYHGLGVSYGQRFRRTGNFTDLEASIKYFQAAIEMTSRDHPALSHMQQSLGGSYLGRYDRLGDMKDLETAISYYLTSMELAPKGHPLLSSLHTSLGASYGHRFRRLGRLDDLDAVGNHFLAAVMETPEGHPKLSDLYHNLGLYYHDKFDKLGEPSDLEDSIKYCLKAIGVTPQGHPDLPSIYQTLGASYHEKYENLGNTEDLEEAFKSYLAAVNETPETHPALPERQTGLAQSYIHRYNSSQNTDDLNEAYKLFKSACQSQIASPPQLWDISVAFTQQKKHFTINQILEGYKAALNILPSLLWLGSSIGNRHETLVLKDVPDVISKAVSSALQVSEIQLAVTFLEQGLSTTYKQILQLRNDHKTLESHFPVLSQRLNEISVQLNSTSHSDQPVDTHSLAHEREQLISTIRQKPGFEDFLFPPNYSRLCLAAEHGPVVMLSCNNVQTDAIIILSPSVPPVHILLDNASVSTIAGYMEKLRNALNGFLIHSREFRAGRLHRIDETSSDRLLQSVVSWLWTSIVKPVFNILNQNGITHGRLWWCPSGPFTYFPLHAAAPVDNPFIQSYTPTLDTLINANEKNASIKISDIMTTVGVVKTSTSLGSWGVLPSVEKELNTVAAFFGDKSNRLQDSQATRESVLEVIQSSPWLHLACHGHQDLGQPLKSGLVLYDGKLELGQILDLNLSYAKFVYLSACETAMGDTALMNEAMHLAGGFLAAGFQGAIGTLWSMADIHGPKVAEVVYKTITEEENIPDVKMTAKGLHLAIQNLRKDGAPLHQWMPFVHLGI
ncbi:CHAT domain-containing protein [Collybia nuda]|uniref:CHAT domain-containing protein n=1 Tax=Collybia nuda TaxID=64659 RepID=A0A9P5XW85_9AGAR|nr:CHAT domain-containing protein [Collybia nuda]